MFEAHLFNLISYLLVKELRLPVAANLVDLLHPNVLQFFRSLFYIDPADLMFIFLLLVGIH